MEEKEFIKLANKHLKIEDRQSLPFGRTFKYITGLKELYKAINFTHSY